MGFPREGAGGRAIAPPSAEEEGGKLALEGCWAPSPFIWSGTSSPAFGKKSIFYPQMRDFFLVYPD